MSKFNRKPFLLGSGIALALPWLETFAETKDQVPAPKRFLSVYHPDGVGLPLKKDPAYKDWSWFPRGGEKNFKLTKVLDVLEPVRHDVTIYSGLSHPIARRIHGHQNADQYLTAGDIGKHGPYKNSISLDQVYASYVGKYTRQASLVMSTNGGIGAPRNSHTTSFNQQGKPIPALSEPKQIFNTLFVASGPESIEKLKRTKSSLDLLVTNAKSFKKKLSRHDQDTLDQYLTAVRETEMKLIKAEQWINTPMPKIDQANLNLEATPRDSRVYLQTIYELVYLAFLSDTTRVANYMMGKENTGGIHDLMATAVGFKDAHRLTHEVKKPGGWKRLGLYNRFQAEEFARFIQKLKDTKEPNGNGTMLDNTIAMHGSASSSFHFSQNYPMITAGGKNLGFNNGRYLKFGKGNEDNQAGAGVDNDQDGWVTGSTHEEEPLAYLFVNILNKLGVETDEFNGYKGTLDRV